jgi:hypothetical protein
MLLGDAGLIPILEVGALASSVAWMSACASCYRLNPSAKARAAAAFGLFITTVMVLVKVLPFVPGHFSQVDWIALMIWLTIGFLVRWRAKIPVNESAAVPTTAGSDVA